MAASSEPPGGRRHGPRAAPRSTARGAAWFFAAAGAYGLSAAPGVMWADSAKLTLYALAGYFPSLNPGDHPGWSLLARAWMAVLPGADPARAANLLSAVAGAAAVALAFALVLRRTGSTARAHTAAAVLLVAHALWWSSSLAESYPPALALALGALVAEGEGAGRALLAGLLAGAGAAVHPFSLVLTLPAVVRRWRAPALWPGFVAGTAPVWLGLVHTARDPLTGHLSARAGAWAWHLHAFVSIDRAGTGVFLVAALLAWNLGPLGIAGLVRGRRPSGPESATGGPRLEIWLAAAYALLLCLYAPYRLHVMVVFIVVALLLAAAPLLSARARAAHVLVQAAAYCLLPTLLAAVGAGGLHVRRLPGRDNARYFLCPVKAADRAPERYARALLAAAPRRALILADFNPGAVIALVRRLRGVRPDVELVPTAVDEALGTADPAATLASAIRRGAASGRPVVLADAWEPYYHPAEIERRFGITTVACGPGRLAVMPGPAPAPPPPPAPAGSPAGSPGDRGDTPARSTGHTPGRG